MERQLTSSGSPFESTVGYSRAVRVGTLVFVSGTTATEARGGTVALKDPYSQTREILSRIGDALAGLGCGMGDVVQTRMYVTDIGRWEEVGRAHGEVFGEVRPATTIVGVDALVSPGMKVEIEAVALAPPIGRGE